MFLRYESHKSDYIQYIHTLYANPIMKFDLNPPKFCQKDGAETNMSCHNTITCLSTSTLTISIATLSGIFF